MRYRVNLHAPILTRKALNARFRKDVLVEREFVGVAWLGRLVFHIHVLFTKPLVGEHRYYRRHTDQSALWLVWHFVSGTNARYERSRRKNEGRREGCQFTEKRLRHRRC